MDGVGVPHDAEGQPRLPTIPVVSSGSLNTAVDVAELLKSIFGRPANQALDLIDSSEITVVTVFGTDPFDEHGKRILVDPRSGAEQSMNLETINMVNIQNIFTELELLVAFSHQLSLHAPRNQNTAARYQKYIDHLCRIAPLFLSAYQARIHSFSLVLSASRESMLESLHGANLLPEQVFTRVYESRVLEGRSNIGLGALLAYSGAMSYKKIFENYLSEGISIPHSEKTDITNQELLIYVRTEFTKSLDFLRRYLHFPEVWKYIQAKHGDVIIRMIFQEFEDLENGHQMRIGQAELMSLTSLDYTSFYKAYVALMNRLLELEVTPSQIFLTGGDISMEPKMS